MSNIVGKSVYSYEKMGVVRKFVFLSPDRNEVHGLGYLVNLRAIKRAGLYSRGFRCIGQDSQS